MWCIHWHEIHPIIQTRGLSRFHLIPNRNDQRYPMMHFIFDGSDGFSGYKKSFYQQRNWSLSLKRMTVIVMSNNQTLTEHLWEILRWQPGLKKSSAKIKFFRFVTISDWNLFNINVFFILSWTWTIALWFDINLNFTTSLLFFLTRIKDNFIKSNLSNMDVCECGNCIQ